VRHYKNQEINLMQKIWLISKYRNIDPIAQSDVI